MYKSHLRVAFFLLQYVLPGVFSHMLIGLYRTVVL